MAQDLSLFLTQTIERELPSLRTFDDVRASIARGPGKWSGKNNPVTLRFVIEDYILHMQHHIDQLLGREHVRSYPGATARD